MAGGNSCNNWSMGEPPKLTRKNFIIWKNRMISFLNCIDSNLLTTIKEGPYIPQEKERSHWSEDDIKKAALDHKAKHIIVMSIPDDIYLLVINCKTAKDIWDFLVNFFEGTDEVREHFLVRRYEMFTSKPGESVTGMYCRFNFLLNGLKYHNKVFDDEYVVEKFLKSLPSEWSSISMVIRDSEDFKNMSLQTVYGKLVGYEQLNEIKNLSVIVQEEKPCHGSECKVVVKDGSETEGHK